MKRWYLVAPLAIGGGLGAMLVDPMLTPLGVLAVMLPVWIYRSRGRLGDPKQTLKQVGQEAGKSTQAASVGAVGLLSGLWFFASTLFESGGEILGTLGGMAAQVPLPLAYWGTTTVGLLGLNGNISTATFAGFALLAFGLGIAAKYATA
ncbi:hypothetical protein [Halobaculum sp. P14]|uniref:hypothetical protein n=1 Tax=Halobaculum sp. P14 TaxID=3421638 RepID=UPI003EC14890